MELSGPVGPREEGSAIVGYRETDQTRRLVFGPESDHPGLEVEVRSGTLGLYMAVAEMAKVDRSAYGPGEQAKVYSMAVRFADEALVAWNLEDESGNPRPADASGLMACSLGLAMSIFLEWMRAIRGESGPAAPLAVRPSTGPTSSGGESGQEETDEGMESLLASLSR